MSRDVRWTRRALGRLDQIGRRIAKDDPDAAGRVIAKLISLADMLAERPAMGRPGRISGTRELVAADISYILPYRVEPDAVEILTILHTAQKWPDQL